MRRRILALFIATTVIVGGLAFGQQQYGTLTGAVEDEQGGVLPGAAVTITSPSLIGGERTAVTGPAGRYTFRNLPPGTYTVRFELAGFRPLTREGIIISVATAITLDVELQVGGVEETITVTGESPVVDVRQNITSTNIDEQIYEAVPTGRNPWVMAGLVPGMVTGQMDVGGNRGMQQYGLEIHGSANSQKSFSIDGLKVNWPGAHGGWTMQYYDFGMYEEYNFQTSAMTAESDVAGVYMNMVTRSGGNDLSGTQTAYFASDGMQGNNVDAELADALGIDPGADTSLSGNPIDVAYDLQATLGGPILLDKAWFFASGRWWRHDEFAPGTEGLGEGGGPVIDDNRITNAMGKVTWQANDRSRLFFMFNKNWKYRYHRNLTDQSFAEPIATNFQKQPAQNFVGNYNGLLGDTAILDLRFGRMWGTTPYLYQEEVGPDDIILEDSGTGRAMRAGPYHYENPNHRYQFNANLNYFLDQANASHDIKFGIQIGRERFAVLTRRNHDILLRAIDGVADEALLYNTPTEEDNRLNTWGAFIQDAWTIGNRLTLNLGVRFDGINGRVPPQTSPAGTWIGERTLQEINDVPDWPFNAAPRLGFAYDLFGDGMTAIKAYYGRTYIQTGSQFTQAVNPVSESFINVPWNDLDGDLFLAQGPSGGFIDSPELDLSRLFEVGFVGGVTTTYDPDTERPYSDLFDIGVEHQLSTDVSLSVRYIRRQHRRGIARIDRARPTSAYSPVTVSYDDPVAGPNQSITAFDLDPAFLVTPDRVIQNIDVLESDYNGVTIDMRKRMSDNWQLLGGVTFGSHKGFDQSDGYYTTIDFNDPNELVNRTNGSVFTDLPWVLTLSGSYNFPHDIILAAKYTGRAGEPHNRTLSVTGLTQGTKVLRAAERGEDRAEAFTKFVDLSLSKSFVVGETARIEPTLQIFNLFNDNTIHLYRDRIGGGYGVPTRLLAPRLFRIGLKWTF